MTVTWSGEALAWLAQGLGAFYVIAALLAIRRLRLDWFMDKALEQLTLKPTGDKPLLLSVMGFAVLYGIAGIALLLRSEWSVWLLSIGILLQVVLAGWRFLIRKDPISPSTVNAAGLSLVAVTVAILAWRSGTLT